MELTVNQVVAGAMITSVTLAILSVTTAVFSVIFYYFRGTREGAKESTLAGLSSDVALLKERVDRLYDRNL